MCFPAMPAGIEVVRNANQQRAACAVFVRNAVSRPAPLREFEGRAGGAGLKDLCPAGPQSTSQQARALCSFDAP